MTVEWKSNPTGKMASGKDVNAKAPDGFKSNPAGTMAAKVEINQKSNPNGKLSPRNMKSLSEQKQEKFAKEANKVLAEIGREAIDNRRNQKRANRVADAKFQEQLPDTIADLQFEIDKLKRTIADEPVEDNNVKFAWNPFIEQKERFNSFRVKHSSTAASVRVYQGTWSRNDVALTTAVDAGKQYYTISGLSTVSSTYYIFLELSSTSNTYNSTIYPDTITISISLTAPVEYAWYTNKYKIIATVDTDSSGNLNNLKQLHLGDIDERVDFPDGVDEGTTADNPPRVKSIDFVSSGSHSRQLQDYMADTYLLGSGFTTGDRAIPYFPVDQAAATNKAYANIDSYNNSYTSHTSGKSLDITGTSTPALELFEFLSPTSQTPSTSPSDFASDKMILARNSTGPELQYYNLDWSTYFPDSCPPAGWWYTSDLDKCCPDTGWATACIADELATNIQDWLDCQSFMSLFTMCVGENWCTIFGAWWDSCVNLNDLSHDHENHTFNSDDHIGASDRYVIVSGNETRNNMSGVLGDGSSVKSVDVPSRQLFVSSLPFASVDWETGVLKDINNPVGGGGNQPSVDWFNRLLKTDGAAPVLDWQNQELQTTGGDVSANWNTAILYGIAGAQTGVAAINWDTGYLSFNNGTTSVSTLGWHDCQLWDSQTISEESIDWNLRIAYNEDGDAIATWINPEFEVFKDLVVDDPYVYKYKVGITSHSGQTSGGAMVQIPLQGGGVVSGVLRGGIICAT